MQPLTQLGLLVLGVLGVGGGILTFYMRSFADKSANRVIRSVEELRAAVLPRLSSIEARCDGLERESDRTLNRLDRLPAAR